MTTSTAYRWIKEAGVERRRRRPPQTEAPTFVQVVRTGDLAAKIGVRVGSAEIEVWRGFDGDLLRAVVEAVATRAKRNPGTVLLLADFKAAA